jgi:hypothetical protein
MNSGIHLDSGPTRLELLRKVLADAAAEKPPTTWLQAVRDAFVAIRS